MENTSFAVMQELGTTELRQMKERSCTARIIPKIGKFEGMQKALDTSDYSHEFKFSKNMNCSASQIKNEEHEKVHFNSLSQLKINHKIKRNKETKEKVKKISGLRKYKIDRTEESKYKFESLPAFKGN